MLVEYVDKVPEYKGKSKRNLTRKGLMRCKIDHFAKTDEQVLHLRKNDTHYTTTKSMETQATYIIKEANYPMLAFRRGESLYIIKVKD